VNENKAYRHHSFTDDVFVVSQKPYALPVVPYFTTLRIRYSQPSLSTNKAAGKLSALA